MKKTFLASELLRTESEVFIFDVPCSAFSPLYGKPAHIYAPYSYPTLTRPDFPGLFLNFVSDRSGGEGEGVCAGRVEGDVGGLVDWWIGGDEFSFL
jgi:hypothetical protein